jgi:hypothetical protein
MRDFPGQAATQSSSNDVGIMAGGWLQRPVDQGNGNSLPVKGDAVSRVDTGAPRCHVLFAAPPSPSSPASGEGGTPSP